MHKDQAGGAPRNDSVAGTGSEIDADLIARVVAGESGAFRDLVERHLGALVAAGRRVLDDAAEAEDIAQEALLRLWRSAATLEVGAAGVRPWLRRVVVNLAIDRVRSRRHQVPTAELPEVPSRPRQEDGLQSADLVVRIRGALALLPERQRQAISLFHFEGLSQLEVGHALGVSDEAVESLLGRGRRALRATLKDDWQDLLPDGRD